MSKLYVDQVDPKTATTLTLGTSGDTVSIPSGVTIANAGTATGFAPADDSITMAKLSTSGTEGDNVRKRVCKVWVQFDGTGTVAIKSDFNVGTLSDYGTGQYGVNFSTALADDDFAAVTGGVKGSYGAGNRINDLSTSLCKIDNWSTSAYTDSAIITLVLMGNSA